MFRGSDLFYLSKASFALDRAQINALCQSIGAIYVQSFQYVLVFYCADIAPILRR